MRALTVLLVSVPIIVLVIYFSWPVIQRRKVASTPCGAVLKLDSTGFEKLGLFRKLSGIVAEEFTEEEEKELSSAINIKELTFSAYSPGFITWEKSQVVSSADYGKNMEGIIDAFKTENLKDVSPAEKAKLDMVIQKIKRISSRAFELGRHDALSPCPF
jgi:hypothetical protein